MSVAKSSVKSRLSPVDLTLSETSTDILEPVTFPTSGNRQASEDQLTPYAPSPMRIQSCDSTPINSCQDDHFSQFLRSPSPDISTTDPIAKYSPGTVLDIDGILSPSTSVLDEAKPPQDGPERDQLPTTCPARKLRVSLRVKPPKTKFKLRRPTAKPERSSERRPSAKNHRVTTQQQSQKKSNLRR